MKKIILTGGGSAGHVTPNIALFPELKRQGYEIQYIGTSDGIERNLIEKENIKYHIISSGKLRRYFDIKNFSDPFKVIKGIVQSVRIMKMEKPNIVFSKGGFVSVPVVIGAYLSGIPVIAHESDITPGLANKISSAYCTKICVTFPETMKNIKEEKAVLTGTPIRRNILNGNKLTGIKLCGFEGKKPILLVIGGSLGSKFLNDLIRKNIEKILIKYDVVHICGKGNRSESLMSRKGYKQFEYVDEELPHIMQAADIILSRAGANLIFEILALKKPNLLIPLSKKSSRGDQIQNAESFRKSGFSEVLYEEEIEMPLFLSKLEYVYQNKSKYVKTMELSKLQDSIDSVINVINKYTK